MKKIVASVVLVLLFAVVEAQADYSLELKNQAGVILHTYTITTAQVEHMQKNSDVQKKSLILKFGGVISEFIEKETKDSMDRWELLNKDFIDSEARK